MTLFSSLGGALSLYLGISVIVGLEVVEYILLLLLNIGRFLVCGKLEIKNSGRASPILPFQMKSPKGQDNPSFVVNDVEPTNEFRSRNLQDEEIRKLRKALYNQFDF